MSGSSQSTGRRKASLRLRFSAAMLPPVRDALVLGHRAPVGESAVVRAMEAISPGEFELVEVDHPVIEALLIRRRDLRKVPKEVLVAEIVTHAAPLMDAEDALHVTLDLEVEVSVGLDL